MIHPSQIRPTRPIAPDAGVGPVTQRDGGRAGNRPLLSRDVGPSPAAIAIRHLGIRLLITLLLAGIIQLFVSP